MHAHVLVRYLPKLYVAQVPDYTRTQFTCTCARYVDMYLAEDLQPVSVLSLAPRPANLLDVADDAQRNIQNIGLLLYSTGVEGLKNGTKQRRRGVKGATTWAAYTQSDYITGSAAICIASSRTPWNKATHLYVCTLYCTLGELPPFTCLEDHLNVLIFLYTNLTKQYTVNHEIHACI